jgi:hypothetical protein
MIQEPNDGWKLKFAYYSSVLIFTKKKKKKFYVRVKLAQSGGVRQHHATGSLKPRRFL